MKTPIILAAVLTFCNLLAHRSYAQNNSTSIDSALVACYPFSGNANDMTGNGNNGTVNGATLVNDRFGNASSAYNFNGSNQNIVLSNFSNQVTGNEFSISFWATATGYATRSAFLMVPDDPANRLNVHVYYGNQLSNSQTFWDFGSIYTTGRLYIATSPIPSGSAWDHWVFVSSAAGSFMKCYKNGVLQLNQSGSSTYSNTQLKNLLIGGGVGVGSSYLWFDGSLDDIRIYKRVLIQNDVTQLYLNNIACTTCPAAQQPSNATPPANLSVCVASNATLSVAGNPTINWYSSPTSTAVLGSGTSYASPVFQVPGTYTYYAKSTTSCAESPVTAITVTVNPKPTITATTSPKEICRGQPAILTATGAGTYSWTVTSGSALITTLALTPSCAVNPSTSTNYTVWGTDANGCKNVSSVSVLVKECVTTGIDEASEVATGSLISPNPNTGEFNISFSLVNENCSLEIYNSLGQRIYQSKLNAGTASVNLKHLPKGVYIVKLFENNKMLKQDKVILE